VERLLVMRGLDTPEKIAAFLHPAKENLGDPFLLKGMAEAVELIRRAVACGQKIAVYGDYDADGVTSTALMVRTLRMLGASVEAYIPDRFREGYGLHAEALCELARRGTRLLVTVDTGISSVEEVDMASRLGMTVIITDHHQPPPELPQADALINPKQPGCPYPFKQLAGVGVALKVAQALLDEVPPELLQLAAVGTISDLMPLVDENRVLVALGLQQLNRQPLPGIQALARQAGLRGEWNSEAIGFILGPRLNAAGRLAHAMEAYRLLMAENEEAAGEAALRLEQLNRQRQQLVEQVFREAEQQLVEQDMARALPPGSASGYVLASASWHAGVIGIAAARLVEKYHRPFILLSVEEESGLAKGSGRGVDGLDLYQVLLSCSQWLEKFGGHQQAAGMTLQASRIAGFRDAFVEEVGRRLADADTQPRTEVEMFCPLEAVDLSLVEDLRRLEPFGPGNPRPILYFGPVSVAEARPLGKEGNHLKLALRGKDGRMVEAVGFHCPDWVQRIASGSRAYVIGSLGTSEWNGIRRPQILLKDVLIRHRQVFDWRRTPEKAEQACSSDASGERFFFSFQEMPAADSAFSEVTDLVLMDVPVSRGQLIEAIRRFPNLQRLYCVFRRTQAPPLPQRQHFVEVFRWMQRQRQFHRAHIEQFGARLGLVAEQTSLVLRVFKELGLLLPVATHVYRLQQAQRQSRLENSVSYLEALEREKMAQFLHSLTSLQLQQFFYRLFEFEKRGTTQHVQETDAIDRENQSD
jgi:single-stranded-DNA-specific exonuclease